MSWVLYGVGAAVALSVYAVVRWLRAGAPRNLGEPAPQIRARAAKHGQPGDFDLYETLKTGAVVLYFFPQAFTAGWNAEAKAYAARLAEYRSLGAELIGVSPDDVATLVRFQQEKDVPQTFVSDPARAIIRAYHAGFGPGATVTKRVTFVISREGKIVHNVYDWNPLSNAGSITRWLKEHPQT